jgi:hypothetical protein
MPERDRPLEVAVERECGLCDQQPVRSHGRKDFLDTAGAHGDIIVRQPNVVVLHKPLRVLDECAMQPDPLGSLGIDASDIGLTIAAGVIAEVADDKVLASLAGHRHPRWVQGRIPGTNDDEITASHLASTMSFHRPRPSPRAGTD